MGTTDKQRSRSAGRREGVIDLEPTVQAYIIPHWHDGDGEKIEFKYNPTELSFDKSVQIAEINIPGLDSPLQQFVRGDSEKVTFDLFFDSTEDGMGTGATSVTKRTDQLYALVKIDPKKHAPPWCTLHWNGKFPGANLLDANKKQLRTAFDCVVESVKQKFTLFSPEGVPLRATVALSLREYKPLHKQLNQLGLSSPDRTHNHVVKHGDSLSGIAAQYYLRPGEWRRIAGHEENNIEDPRRLAIGKFLTIPIIP